MSREKWQHYPFNRDNAGRQLALSESLLNGLELPGLYWYVAGKPALILGAAQKLDILDLDYCQEAGYAVYKRTSGGATVLAGPKFLSLDVALPVSSQLASPDITRAYKWLGQTWQTTLTRLGLATELVEPAAARASNAALTERINEAALVKLVCFGTLSSYEVADRQGRKLIGLAQIKRRQGSLLQCGIALDWPATEFARVFAQSAAEKEALAGYLAEHASGLAQLTPQPPSVEQIITTFESVLTELWPVALVPIEWPMALLTQAEKLADEKFPDLVQ